MAGRHSLSRTVFTLIFVTNNKNYSKQKVLLGLKTRGFGVGKWNGFGGKVELEETVDECAHRELLEECHIQAEDLAHKGVVRYIVEDENAEHLVHIFTCKKYKGKELASEEMNPIVWYNYEDIPYDRMWPDTKIWLKFVLFDKFFTALITYDNDKIISSIITEVDCLKQVLDF